jgi:hypothetical protein
MTEKLTIDGKEYELKHVAADYSTPKATKWLDAALKAEERGSESMVDKALDKAVDAEKAGE